MTTSSGTRHTTFTAFLVGARSLWQHPGLAVAFLVATLTQGTLQGGMVWALRQVLIILNGPGGMNRRVLLVGALAVCAIWFVRAAGIYAAQVLAGRLASRVELRWMREVLEKLLTLPVSFFDKSSRGDLVMTAYNDTKTVRLVTVQFGQLVLYLSQLAGLMVAAWAMSAKLTLIGLFFAPLGCVPVYWLGRRLTEAARREQKQGVSLQDSYLQLTSGIRVIKVNAGESQILERARQVSQQLWRSVLRQIHAGGLARLLLDGVEGFGLILILVIGGADVAAGRMPWQSLLGLPLAVMAIYAPVLGLLSIYSYIRQPIPDFERLANNIRMGRPGPPLDEVVAAAKAAGVHDEILQMEFGYETVVGTGPEARGLSGGQKQRICVAAALLKNAPLLFLDEATNSLDSVSEAKVQAAIERLMRHRTTFVIAHRFSTLRNADRIIVLEQGRMVGFDSRTRLLTSCKTFRKLWPSQMALVSNAPEVLPRRPEMMDV